MSSTANTEVPQLLRPISAESPQFSQDSPYFVLTPEAEKKSQSTPDHPHHSFLATQPHFSTVSLKPDNTLVSCTVSNSASNTIPNQVSFSNPNSNIPHSALRFPVPNLHHSNVVDSLNTHIFAPVAQRDILDHTFTPSSTHSTIPMTQYLSNIAPTMTDCPASSNNSFLRGLAPPPQNLHSDDLLDDIIHSSDINNSLPPAQFSPQTPHLYSPVHLYKSHIPVPSIISAHIAARVLNQHSNSTAPLIAPLTENDIESESDQEQEEQGSFSFNGDDFTYDSDFGEILPLSIPNNGHVTQEDFDAHYTALTMKLHGNHI